MSENQKKDVEMKDATDKATEEAKAPEVVDPFFGKLILCI